MTNAEILEKIHRGVIVSCQALPDEPLYGYHFMGKMALAAKEGGDGFFDAAGFTFHIYCVDEEFVTVGGQVIKNCLCELHVRELLPAVRDNIICIPFFTAA